MVRNVGGGTVVPNMAEKRVIKAIIEMREQGMTLRQVASCLDHIGVPTKKRGKKWHPEMVKRILSKNKSVEGSSLLNGQVHQKMKTA